MAASVILAVDCTDDTSTALSDILKLGSTQPYPGFQAVRNLLRGIHGGTRTGKMTVSVGASALVAAIGKVTCVQASITAGDIVYVGSVGFVATNGAVTLGQATYDMRTSNTAVGASLAAQINAHASLTGIVTATAATGTVTITSVQKGALSTQIRLAKAVTTNAAHVLNGNAATVLTTVLGDGTTGSTAGTGGLDSAPVVYNISA